MKEFKPFCNISPPAKGRRLVIPDIHGCIFTFEALLEKVEIDKNDQLFLLGDYIDRGKYGPNVIRLIMRMLKEGYQVFPLRGNHEDMVWKRHIAADNENSEIQLPSSTWGKGIVGKNRKIFPEFKEFIENLPYYYNLGDFLLVHAGVNFSVDNPLEDHESMLWKHGKTVPPSNFEKGFVHGHKIMSIEDIRQTISDKNQVINLDNGCAYNSKKGYGSLLCLNIDTYDLYVQENIEK